MSEIKLNVNQKGEKYKPLWKKLITAGRAAEGLRDEWRKQLKELQKEIGFEYIRFHGIFHDEMMIYHENENGTPTYNWQYFDSLFDFLQEVNLRPILELGFMPSALATGDRSIFWWKGNITPPKDYSKWAALVKALVCHCIGRYELSEVLKWYFEVWNEPDIYQYFWDGTQEEYFKLYEYTTTAIKSINPSLKVGGPASSGSKEGYVMPWVEDFLAYCEKKKLPVDFVSTHPYPNSWPLDIAGNCLMVYRGEDATYNDVKWTFDTVRQSAFSDAEIHLTEWNSSPSPRDLVHDTAFMAPFIIRNNIKCLGLANSLGFWAFTDIFEENEAGMELFHGGFGLINAQGFKKPSYYGYWFLSRLGEERLASGENYFVTRKEDKIQILLWNYCHYNSVFAGTALKDTEPAGSDRTLLTQYDRYSFYLDKMEKIRLTVDGLEGKYKITTFTLGRNDGSAFDIWLKNGALSAPTREEIEILNKKIGPTTEIQIIEDKTYSVEFELKPHDVVLIEISRQVI